MYDLFGVGGRSAEEVEVVGGGLREGGVIAAGGVVSGLGVLFAIGMLAGIGVAAIRRRSRQH